MRTKEAQLQDHEEDSAGVPQNSCSSLSLLQNENDTGKFVNLKFRTKLRSCGRPKRNVRQLCSFNKSQADTEVRKLTRRNRENEKIQSLNRRSGVKKRRAGDSNDDCPVCDVTLSHTDLDVVTTNCCSTLIHDDCRLEFSDCPLCATNKISFSSYFVRRYSFPSLNAIVPPNNIFCGSTVPPNNAILSFKRHFSYVHEPIFEIFLSILSPKRFHTNSPLRFYLISSYQQFVPRISSCLLYTSPSPRDRTRSRMPSSA